MAHPASSSRLKLPRAGTTPTSILPRLESAQGQHQLKDQAAPLRLALRHDAMISSRDTATVATAVELPGVRHNHPAGLARLPARAR